MFLTGKKTEQKILAVTSATPPPQEMHLWCKCEIPGDFLL